MQRDKHPAELGKDEYSIMINGNFQDEHGNGPLILQNEPSNLLCSRFKDGYKVVGHKYDINANRTYFFLTNPSTGCSEIGYVDIVYNFEGLEAVEDQCGCNLSVVLEQPLETVDQTEICTYTTLITDYCESIDECTGCLNFNIFHPIYPENIQIKDEKTGKTIYWTDYFNPQRYLQLDRLEIYNQEVDDCTGEIRETCLLCDKLRIFKEFDKPCLRPRVIQNGGNLRAGMYEVLIAYSDLGGNNISNFYALTNPVPIFDKNNNILDQTNLDYLTNQAIAVDVIDLDPQYEYYKISVIYRSGLDSAVTYFDYGVYPSGTTKVTISTLENKQSTTLQNLLSRRPYYLLAQGLAASNGYLFQYGLKTHREINLQPVVNLLGSLVKWQTYQATEDLYEDGVYISNYLGYMRDEVFPLSIKFFIDGGYETPNFVFIPRPPTDFEIDILGTPDFPDNTNTASINQYNPECGENNRIYRWQYENTAEILGTCDVPTSGYEESTVIRTIEASCYPTDEDGNIDIVDFINSSSVEIDSDLPLVDWINQNAQDIIDSTGLNGADIRDILEDPSEYPEECTPEFGSNCSDELTLVSEEIIAISVDTEIRTQVPQDYDEYDRVLPPTSCDTFLLDGSGNPQQDTTFESDFMEPSEVVYKRAGTPTNMSCFTAQTTPYLTSPQIDNYNYLVNQGESGGGISTLQTALTVSAVRTSYGITLTGTSGTANITVDGTPYLATFSTNLTTTASNFVTAHAAAIFTATGATVISSGPTILITEDASLSPTVTIANVSGDLDGEIVSVNYTNKLHTNAIWFKVDFNGLPSTIVELSPVMCTFSDDNSGSTLRISVFDTCSSTSDEASYGRIVDSVNTFNDGDKFIELSAADFTGTSAYVVIDSPIKRRVLASSTPVATLTPPCGCFSIYQREAFFSTLVEYTNLRFGKRQTWSTECSFVIPNLNGCDPIPNEYGLFSYWESEEKYPCTKELYDSSNLLIKPSDIPVEFQAEFENYYTTGVDVSGNYILVPETNFMDLPIRHYKFPCNTSVPFFSFEKQGGISQDPGSFNKSVIYPIGFFLSNSAINAFLDIAVNNGLITLEERQKINKYEIFRGDRRTDKSVIAKGLLFDIYSYTQDNDSVYYPNYPLNSLGTDMLNGNVPHLYQSLGNNFFTFHSPDTHFYKPTLPRELKVEGYQFGKAAVYFDEVRGHSTYVILGDKAYTLATSLAIAEVVFESTLQIADLTINAFTGGAGLPAATVAAVAAAIAIALQSVIKVGEYRYEWLETLRNLGQPNNFAYYSVATGHYNYFYPNPLADSMLRGISSSAYINAGRWSVADESAGFSLDINNFDREDSVFLSLGNISVLDTRIIYPTKYVQYDNSTLNPTQSSRARYPGVGRSSRIQKNAASPYVALKQYLPSQYGDIQSIQWVHTAYCGNLNEDNSCNAVFGGDTYISRFSIKRKLPFFTSNAARLAPLIPFQYSNYFNINPEEDMDRYYVDYEINDESQTFFSLLFFPDTRTNFNYLDYLGSSSKFYIKPPAKFYLFSYGIPYFLVESEINCNFRYAKREPHENFYPNIGDTIEFTQEENVSIKEPNTYFYNFVYSFGHTNYPWRILPNNYSEDLYAGLNDLSSTTIYSLQDNTENSLLDPWLMYRPLDAYQFPTSYGKLIDLSGIESEQVLGRFNNGITIFGAIDMLRDRLTPENAELGTGGIFTGRNINFNKTDLGYAGTQHKAKVSSEFGHAWTDAKRGKVFMLAPNAGGLEEITQGLEKWFKENLPFKITNTVPNAPTDNHYYGLGITMGWDDRLKRLFLTKLDYKPKQDVSYQEDLGFYVGEPVCPEDFVFIDGMCVYEDIQPKEEMGTPLDVINAGNASHGFATPALYSAYNADGTADVDPMSSTGFTYQNLTAPFWTGNGVVTNRLTTLFGKWVSPSTTNVWYGATSIVELTNSQIYYVILAADNLFRFKVDGVTILTSDPDLMGPQHGLSAPLYQTIPFRKVHIYPVELKEGCHTITIEGLNEGGAAMFGAAILDNTEAEIVAATAYSDLNFVYSTETETEFFEETITFTCPEGYVARGAGICDDCILRLEEEAEYDLVQLTDSQYFEDCSWTVAYSPLTKTWISYYDFHPNYYVSYDNYFQTGVNYSADPSAIGLWSHFSFLSSYQVFYGRRYKFLIEVPVTDNILNSVLHNVEFWLEVRKYYNRYDFAIETETGFNKAFIYNSHNNSGQLDLVVQDVNDGRQLIQYPQHNPDSISILQTRTYNNWSFNYFYNVIKKENSGLPVWINSCNQIEKRLDNDLLDYRANYKDRLRGEHFLVRLINDKESRFKFLYRRTIDKRDFYE